MSDHELVKVVRGVVFLVLPLPETFTGSPTGTASLLSSGPTLNPVSSSSISGTRRLENPDLGGSAAPPRYRHLPPPPLGLFLGTAPSCRTRRSRQRCRNSWTLSRRMFFPNICVAFCYATISESTAPWTAIKTNEHKQWRNLEQILGGVGQNFILNVIKIYQHLLYVSPIF